MAEGDGKSVETRLIDTLVSNTEAMSALQAAMTQHNAEYVEGRRAAREHANNVTAKLDNYDRSIAEMRLAMEKGELARQAELKRIYDILGEERKDRRRAVSEGQEGGKSEREMLRDLIREEMGDRRMQREENRGMFQTAVSEVWKAGGRYIVAGLVLLFLALVGKVTGMSLADLIGLTGK